MSVLTISTLTRLAIIAEAAHQGTSVKWTTDEGETILSGTVRSIGREDFTFLRDEDVRDAYLRVTGDSGREHALAISDVLDMLSTGSIAFRA